MITLNASGGSVTFEFSGNSTYLNDGTITVPVNSLALIIDESDMATFRKSASNDIFVSANIAEFGMTKAELESWYKANMVGSTGGGSGSGVTPSEVQTMIDESISGKADTSYVDQSVSGKANSSDVYTTGQTSGATQISSALAEKLDATAYTPTVVDAALSQSSTNPVQNKVLYDELRVENETLLTFSDNIATNYPSGCTTIKVEVSGTGDMETIGFYDSNWAQIGQVVIDTVHGYIAVDSNFEGSTYTINGNIVTISYPSITNVKYLYTGNLYTYKAVTSVSTLKDVVNGKANQSDFTAYTANTQTVLNSKLDATAYTPVQVSTAITENDTNPVAGGAVYDKVHVTSGESSETTLIFEERIVGGTQAMFSTNYPSGATIVKLDINNVPSYLGYFGWYGADESFLGGAKITQDGGNIGVKFNYTELNPAMSGTASYTDNVLTVEVTGFQNASLSDIAYFSHDLMSTYNSIKAVTTPKEYWIKEYVDAALSGKANSSDVYTKSETSGATEIATALSGKQDTLSAGTGIEISGNVISATGGGGGGKAVSAGTNISITTGETADTINCTLPITAGTGWHSILIGAGTQAGGNGSVAEGYVTYANGDEGAHAEGFTTYANGKSSHAEGCNSKANGSFSHAEGNGTNASGHNSHAEGVLTKAIGRFSHTEGYHTIANWDAEHASGQYNVSSSGSSTFGDSGNTLFSVGNGTADNARHNAFEIRQNGDIYFEYDGNDIKLQDKLDEIETVTAAALNNLNDRVSEDEEVTAAALNNLNDRFGGLSLVKLTQQQYDNLQTKDSNTLYVIVN